MSITEEKGYCSEVCISHCKNNEIIFYFVDIHFEFFLSVLFGKVIHQILDSRARFEVSWLISMLFNSTNRILIHSQIDERTISGNSLFFYVFVILFHKKERFSYGHRFKRRIEKNVINFSLVTSNRLRYKRNLSKNKRK